MIFYLFFISFSLFSVLFFHGDKPSNWDEVYVLRRLTVDSSKLARKLFCLLPYLMGCDRRGCPSSLTSCRLQAREVVSQDEFAELSGSLLKSRICTATSLWRCTRNPKDVDNEPWLAPRSTTAFGLHHNIKLGLLAARDGWQTLSCARVPFQIAAGQRTCLVFLFPHRDMKAHLSTLLDQVAWLPAPHSSA